jgi:hypothetical protein
VCRVVAFRYEGQGRLVHCLFNIDVGLRSVNPVQKGVVEDSMSTMMHVSDFARQ